MYFVIRLELRATRACYCVIIYFGDNIETYSFLFRLAMLTFRIFVLLLANSERILRLVKSFELHRWGILLLPAIQIPCDCGWVHSNLPAFSLPRFWFGAVRLALRLADFSVRYLRSVPGKNEEFAQTHGSDFKCMLGIRASPKFLLCGRLALISLHGRPVQLLTKSGPTSITLLGST